MDCKIFVNRVSGRASAGEFCMTVLEILKSLQLDTSQIFMLLLLLASRSFPVTVLYLFFMVLSRFVYLASENLLLEDKYL